MIMIIINASLQSKLINESCQMNNKHFEFSCRLNNHVQYIMFMLQYSEQTRETEFYSLGEKNVLSDFFLCTVLVVYAQLKNLSVSWWLCCLVVLLPTCTRLK